MLSRLMTPVRATVIGLCGVAFALVLIGWVQWGCPSANATCAPGFDWTYQANPMGENYVVFANTNDATSELAAVQAAHATWNADPATFDFTYGGSATNAAPANDGVNQIRWGSTSGSLATTTIWTNTTTGDILEADCVFNDSFTWSTASPTPAGQFDIESVMLHEFGHILGLDHSTAPAIMQPSIPNGTQRRTLNADDQAGIRAIYGGGTAPPPAGLPKSLVLILAFMVLVGAVSILLRRRELTPA